MKATIKYDEMYYDCEAVDAFVNKNESVTFNNGYIFAVIDRKNIQEIIIS